MGSYSQPSFTAVIDAHAGADAVLPAHPTKLIAESDKNVPYIIGETRGEGLGFALGNVYPKRLEAL